MSFDGLFGIKIVYIEIIYLDIPFSTEVDPRSFQQFQEDPGGAWVAQAPHTRKIGARRRVAYTSPLHCNGTLYVYLF